MERLETQELISALAARAHSASNDGHYSTAHALYFSAAIFSRLTSHIISASNMLYKDGQAEEAERSYRTIVESKDKLAPNALSSIEQKMADIAAGKRSPGGRPLGSPPSPIVVIGTIGKTLGDQLFASGLAASESAGDAYTAWSLFASCYALGGGMPARIKLADMLLRLARPSEARAECELMLSLTGVRDKLSPKNEELVRHKLAQAISDEGTGRAFSQPAMTLATTAEVMASDAAQAEALRDQVEAEHAPEAALRDRKLEREARQLRRRLELAESPMKLAGGEAEEEASGEEATPEMEARVLKHLDGPTPKAMPASSPKAMPASAIRSAASPRWSEFPPVLTSLSEWVNQLGGIDLEMYESFNSQYKPSDWTRNPVSDEELFTFAMDGSGGQVALWRNDPNATSDSLPVVFLGSEGEIEPLATSLPLFMHQLANGFGPIDLAFRRSSEILPNEGMIAWVKDTFPQVAFKDPKAIWTDAKTALSGFEQHLRSHLMAEQHLRSHLKVETASEAALEATAAFAMDDVLPRMHHTVGEEAAAADADAAEQAIGMSGFSAGVATLSTPSKPALITALVGGPSSIEMTPASKHGPSPSALPGPAAVMSRFVNNLGRVAAVEAASKVVKASEAEAIAASKVVEAMAASEAEARMEPDAAAPAAIMDAAAPAIMDAAAPAIMDAAAPALVRAPASEPTHHSLAAPAPAVQTSPVAVPLPTPTAKAPKADAASSAKPAKPEAQPGSAQLLVAKVLSPNTALPSGAPLLRLIVVGDSGIGKSALLERFVHARFGAKGALATLSVDLSTANVSLGAQAVSVQLFDTAGQERFAPLIGPYYRHADGVLVAYDVGHRTSFERAIAYWASEIAKNATPGTPVVLVGTKADRLCEPGYRRVETREAEEAANALGWPYCGETSAATGVSVGEAFYLLSCEVMNARFDAGRAADGGAPPIKAAGVELREHPKGAAGCAC